MSARRSLIGLVALYRRRLSPLMGRHCRFYPTCSHYAEQAIDLHGIPTGAWLTLKRIGRCHPWSVGGVDHVPARRAA